MIALAGFSVMTCSEEEQAHEHNFTISAFDDIHHWKKCNCGEVDLSSYKKNIITKVIPIHTGSAVIAEYPTKKNLMSGF